MKFLTKLTEYEKLLVDNKDFSFISNELSLKGQTLKIFDKYCFYKPIKFLPLKLFATKRFIKKLSKVGFVKRVKVKYNLKGKHHAYALEKGEINFGKQFVFKMPFEKNVFETLHELAHIYLSYQAGYKEFVELDLEFATKYLKEEIVKVITPIEYYANALAIGWLKIVIENHNGYEKRKKLLSAEITTIESKIKRAKAKAFCKG